MGEYDRWRDGGVATLETQDADELGDARRAGDRGRMPDRGPEPVPSVAAIAGHPLHPSVVPLPIGAFVGAFASDLAYAATGDRFFARSSRLLLAAGIGTGLVAGSLGAMDFLGRKRIREHGSAWIHAGGNVGAIGLATVNLMLRQRDETRSVVPKGLLLSSILVGALSVTAWLGGELTYRHRIGVTATDR
jgi:uncharacterized membrane protein